MKGTLLPPTYHPCAAQRTDNQQYDNGGVTADIVGNGYFGNPLQGIR